ncbi:N-acetyltransferase family protein [Bacillus sp. NPDC077027]|uniref:GNAT family N-acetyltransferase n=1 Tax=Bacillus sp. NPDC077027 TaxID=3390548 RepID=UPI003D007C60
MQVTETFFTVNGLTFQIRSARETDAQALSALRFKIDGETEFLDREQGEAFIDEDGFKQIIREDTEKKRHLFLVAVVREEIVGFSRCEGSPLKRFAHKVEFGIAIRKDYWGYAIGRHLLTACIHWADTQQIKKMALHVLETNQKAIRLYEQHGFEIEGLLKNDKVLSDGRFYHTVVMGRHNQIDSCIK